MDEGGTYEYEVTKPKQTYDYNFDKVFSKNCLKNLTAIIIVVLKNT